MSFHAINLKAKIISLLLTCLLASSLKLPAQQYSFVQYTEKDGLPSAVIYDIMQDRKGFIWLATENGVVRFDGARFKVYTTKNGLPDNTVFKIMEDSQGRLWVNPFMNIPHYLKGDVFIPWNFPEPIKNELRSTTNFFCKEDLVFFESEKTAFVLDPDNSIKKLHEYNPLIPPGSHVSGFGSKRHELIYAINEQVYKINGTEIEKLPWPKSKIDIFWLNSRSEWRRSEPVDARIYPKGKANVSTLYGVSADQIYYFDGETGNLSFRIQIQRATASMIDKEGNIWVATEGFGLYRYPSVLFRSIKPDNRLPEVFSFGNHTGRMLAGGNISNLYTLSANGYSSENFSRFLHISGNTPTIISGQNRTMKIISRGRDLFVGTDAFLIKKEDAGNVIGRNYYPIKDLHLSGNRMLVCTGKGALLVNPTDLSVTDTLFTQRTTSGILYRGRYFIGTTSGLVVIDSLTKKIVPSALSQTMPGKRITRITRGNNDDFWIATSGAGLIQIKNDRIVRTITEANGLSSDICSDVFTEADTIWAGTNKGLSKIMLTKDSFSVQVFTTADGLSSNVVNAVYTDSHYVYTGSAEGVTYFHKNYSASRAAFPLYLSEVLLESKVLPLDSVYTFPSDAFNIRFGFSALSFKSAGNMIYYYQLEGLENRWNSTSNDFINFATLAPGDYHLKVKAVDKFGAESNELIIHITITPPWWRTWWFIGSLFVLVSGAVFLLYRRRVYLIQRNEEIKRKTEAQFAALEQQALQAQMNPHFIFNCLNSIQSFIISNDVYGANRYLTSFASLIRQTLDNSGQSRISLNDEIRYLATYLELESMRFENRFTYSIRSAPEIDTQFTYIPAMLLQPYVENAIRHGLQHRNDRQGHVAIRFEKDKDRNLCCIITDNGVGREQSKLLQSASHIEYQSKGTAITQKRIEMINMQYQTNILVIFEDLETATQEPGGTRVTLTFPETFIQANL